MSDKKKPIRILRTGTFTSVAGASVEFTEAMLQEIAASYDPAKHQAPIVIGHPKLDAPAFGWIKGVSLADGFLEADPDQVDPAFAELVNAGKFKHVSASFYTPTAANNPTPGKWSLRHLGFLGAQPPAVKGLGAVSFGEDDADTVAFDFAEDKFADGWDLSRIAGAFRRFKNWIIDKEGQDAAEKIFPEWEIEGMANSAARKEAAAIADGSFSEPQPQPEPQPNPPVKTPAEIELADREATLNARQAELDARDRKVREAANAEFADGLIGLGRLTPAQKPMVLTILQELDGGNEVSFGEGDAAVKLPSTDAFKKFLESLPKAIDLGERAALTETSVDLSDPEAVGQAALQLIDAEAAKGVHITAVQAVARIKQQGA
ncbi:MAG: hypothetical protein KG075_07545 [Alphaproteobacteria bacterium]|nr:hypothetical protein [Alphaproteobacteria bacterium]